MNDILGNCKPSDIPLFEFPIWARVYNLPFKGRLNSVNMKAIGDKIGTFIKMDHAGVMGIDKSVRVRVMHDLRRPLVSSVRVKMKSGVEEDFDVKYERPPLFCFICGKVGHGLKDCEEEEGEHSQEIKFGGLLKASPWKVREARDSDWGGSGTKKCVKALFITKPKRDVEEQIQEKVSAVVERLTQCGIDETHEITHKEIRVEISKEQVVGEPNIRSLMIIW